jgi:hypothetical protein
MAKTKPKPKTLSCLLCHKSLKNLLLSEGGIQPQGGLAFETYGHYGSTYFDPMDGHWITLTVCDLCVAEAEKAGRVHRSEAKDMRRAEFG